MKKIQIIISAAAFMVFAACGDSKTDEKETSPETEVEKDTTTAETEEENTPPMDSAAMMKAWTEYMTPGDMHNLMAKYNGTFNAEVTMWMDPAAPPSTSKATTVNKMILGNRYQESTHNGNFNGMPFEGKSIMGYDNAKKKFVSTWVDNMGSGIMVMEGSYDEGTKTISTSGTMTDPMTGKDCTVRETMQFVDDNTQIMEMYSEGPDGKEYKNMEIKYTRKK